MAISHVGSNTQDSGGAQSLTFTVPAATTTDDLILVFVKQSENTGAQVWDDDGGGGNGYTRAQYNRTTSGRDQETAVYWKFATSGSEANPTFTWNSGGTNEPMSGIMEVYRDVDPDFFDSSQVTYLSGTNDANPPNAGAGTIDFDDSWIVVNHAATHDDISTVAAPTGYTLRSQVWNGTADDHRNNFTADISNIDVSASPYTPPDWGHTVLNSTPEYHCYTVQLTETQSIAVTGGTVLDGFNWGDQNLTVTGKGFGATQGTGKVEIWDDTSGTTKTTQTIDSWSDTSIQIDTVQGSLPNDTTVYVVVTAQVNGESNKASTNVGLLPYNEVMVSEMKPDHYWRLNNTYDDTGVTGPVRNMTSGIVGTWTFNTAEIVDGNTHALNYSSVTNRRECADSPNMNITIDSAERTLSFWLELGSIQPELACIWKEGGGVQNLAFFTGVGNTLLFQGADTPGFAINAQAWSDFKLALNRPYHICGLYSLTDDELLLFIDGVEQTDTDGNPLGTGSFNSHSGDIVWGDPDTNLETGATDISYNTHSNAKLSDFATWSDNSTNTDAGRISDTDIRDKLYRRGAIPDDTVSSGTEAAMQTALEALNETRTDSPLSLRVEGSTSGNFELTMEDSSGNPWTFEDRISSQVEYRGSDTLTLVRTPGGNLDAAKCWSLSGGTVTVVDDVDLTLTVRDIDDNSVIVGARVRITADTGGPETVGTVLLEGVTDVSGQVTTRYRFSSSQPVTGRVRKGTSSTYYKTSDVVSTITSNGLDDTVFMIKDE